MSARFGSLTFAKRWLVCRAKGNVPNVGRLSTFLSCGWAKKLNLFSVIVISFFHSQTIISVIFGVSVFFFALLLTVCSYKKLAIFTTNVHAENQCLINHKCVCGALNRQFLVGAVMGWFFSLLPNEV